MSWVTIIWSMEIAASLTLAAIHLVIWSRRRAAWANLLFAGVAVSLAGMAVFEFLMMRAQTPAEFSAMNRGMHVTAFAISSAIVWFIRVYLRAGRMWFLWSVIIWRALVLALNFILPVDVNYREIHALAHPMFLGEPVSVAQGVRSPWSWMDEMSALWLIAFVVDASVMLWRRGDHEDRRRAVVVGGSMALFVLVALTQVTLVRLEVIRAPQIAGFSFMFFLTAMAVEMSRDLLRAAQLADDLRESEQRMKLAGEAARLGMWTWDLTHNEIWINDAGRALYGWTKSEPVSFDGFLAKLHVEDRESMREAVHRSLQPPGVFDAEFRVLLSEGEKRWISARGQVEFNDKGQPLRLRGVSIDITARKEAEAEAQRQRSELAHVARVSMMGEMAASVAHELNQPLTAMVNNASAARRMIEKGTADPAEMREIFSDIAADGQRAGEVIRGIRSLARRDGGTRAVLQLDEILAAMRRMIAAEAVARNCTVMEEIAPTLPRVEANAVQIQQVLLNFVMNAFDAVDMPGATARHVVIRMEAEGKAGVLVSVRDHGPGLPPEGAAKLFEPFHTTKPGGMGIGLAIARSIVEEHGGSLGAADAEGGGARFYFRLPAAKEAEV